MPCITEIENLPAEVAEDLISLTKILVDIPRRGVVNYSTREKGKIDFKYCLLDDILDTVKKCEAWAVLTPLREAEDGRGEISAVLIHKSGYILKSPPYKILIPAQAKPQDRGTQITYARRYVLSSFLNIAAEDDFDGADEAAEIKPALPKKAVPAPAPVQKPEPPKTDYQKLYTDIILNSAINQGVSLQQIANASRFVCIGERELGDLKVKDYELKELLSLMLSKETTNEEKSFLFVYLSKQNPEKVGFCLDSLELITRAYRYKVNGKTLASLSGEELRAIRPSDCEDQKIYSAISYLIKCDPTKA